MKIESEKYGIIHACAFCDICDWGDCMIPDEEDRMQKLRNMIYRHVRATGHSVTLETGNSTRYTGENNGRYIIR